MGNDGLRKVHWLSADDPPDSFPPPEQALSDPNGLLAIGGDLSSERLLFAYKRGIFPWYTEDEPLLWWSPNPRAVLFPNEFHVSRSLRRTLKRENFSVSVDNDFPAVIRDCARLRTGIGTWITAPMDTAFNKLHSSGHAHSIEVWQENELVGGMYGVNIGGVYFGESMFSRATDASKVALLFLTRLCREFRIGLIDCQVASPHLATLGSREISRDEFQRLLARFTAFPAPDDWHRDRKPARVALSEA